jgi:hypothetical protein
MFFWVGQLLKGGVVGAADLLFLRLGGAHFDGWVFLVRHVDRTGTWNVGRIRSGKVDAAVNARAGESILYVSSPHPLHVDVMAAVASARNEKLARGALRSFTTPPSAKTPPRLILSRCV